MYWTRDSMNNLLSYCGLIDAKTKASVHSIPSWLDWAGLNRNYMCRAFFSPKTEINQFKPVQESIQQAIKAYFPNLYMLWFQMMSGTVALPIKITLLHS